MLEDKFGHLEVTPPVYSAARQRRTSPFETLSGATNATSTGHTSPFGRYFVLLARRKWIVSSLILFMTAATYLACRFLTPMYESTATIDIDLQAPHGILGQDSQNSPTMNDADQILATQASLVESDLVLRPVADKYNLLALEGQRANIPGNDKYFHQAPIHLKRLKVKRSPNTYLLKISYQSENRDLAADVANAVTSAYIDHTYRLRSQSSSSLSSFMEGQLGELRLKMEKSNTALAKFENELNVVNPEEKTSIVSARLLQLNSLYTDAQAERMKKEAFFNSTKSGTPEAAQMSPQAESLMALMEKENEARVRLTNVTQVYGAKHPDAKKAKAELTELQRQIETTRNSIRKASEVDYQQALNREQMVGRAVVDSKAEFDRLNSHSFEYQQVRREAEGDRKLYEDLVRKIREAGINAGFQNSAIRIADLARPSFKPLFPNTPLYVAVMFVLSTILVTGAFVLAGLSDNTVSDPDELAKAFGARVLGTLPGVKSWKDRRPPLIGTNDFGDDLNTTPSPLPSMAQSSQPYIESIRSLRTPILLDHSNRRIRVLLITSSLPGEGKSTAAAHLALSYTAQGKKVLLIDGDLRRPSLHRSFDLSNTQGLTDVILGRVQWREARLTTTHSPHLDVLPAGAPSRQACDLIERISQVVEQAANEYDLVIVDSPPVLGFAEPLEMAPAADGVVVITRAGETNRKALEDALTKLTEVRANILGIVLNGFTPAHSENYYKYYRSPQPYATA